MTATEKKLESEIRGFLLSEKEKFSKSGDLLDDIIYLIEDFLSNRDSVEIERFERYEDVLNNDD